MDYMGIVLKFKNDQSIIDYLDKYFARECKKAEANYYGKDEFFHGCQSALNQLKNSCMDAFENRKQEQKKLLEKAEIEKDDNSIMICSNELKYISIEKFSVPLYLHHKSYSGHIDLKQINFIEQRLNDAKKEIFGLTPDEQNNKKKYDAKYYALYHHILIKLGIEDKFEMHDNNKFRAGEIKNFAEQKYKNCSSQMFYKSFREIDLTKMVAIAKCYKNYKDIIIDISNNDSRVISELRNYPN